MKKCIFTKSDGNKCQANAMKESQFCFSHNPDMEEERKSAVSRGGSSPRRNYKPLPPVKIESTKDIVNLISTTISEIRAGSIELRVANCIGYLSGHLIKAFEVSSLEERLTKLEEIISREAA